MSELQYDLVVKNGDVVLPGTVTTGSIGIAGGKIAAIVDGSVALSGTEEVDAGGSVVLPGIIDAHVHLRDPGLTHKEDFDTGTQAAALGGVTTIADMPNVNPATIGGRRFREKAADVRAKAHVDYLLWAGATQAQHVYEAAEAGAPGVKVFMIKGLKDESEGEWTGRLSPHSPELHLADDGALLAIFEAAAEVKIPVAVHLGNQGIWASVRGGWAGMGFSEAEDVLRNETPLDKVEAAQRCVLLAEHTGAHLHIVHIPGAVLPTIRDARARGVKVTAESFYPFMSFDLMRTVGPLGFNRYKSNEEIEALWSAVFAGDIDFIATDHAPHTLAEKQQGHGDILSCPSGYPELETGLPMLLEQVRKGRLSLPTVAQIASAAPAKFLGVGHRKGKINLGYDADLTIVNTNERWTISNEGLATKNSWTPFAGIEATARPHTTILRGNVIVRDGALAEVGQTPGELLTPTR